MSEACKLYRTTRGIYVQRSGSWFTLPQSLTWPELTTRDDLHSVLWNETETAPPSDAPEVKTWLAPIAAQEVWAAGVTYMRSRSARMEESETEGGKTFYDLVYNAERPELFFKATPNRVVGHNGAIKIRSDSRWNVPEPELALLLTPAGTLLGYTVGNDVSSRDIEGENPLYLPQAKVYDRSCAVGPCLLITPDPPAPETAIELRIEREDALVFHGQTELSQMKRTLASLVTYLFRDNVFPHGCFLLTGTGIVPDAPITLQRGDVTHITIPAIGTLTNQVD